MKHKYNKKKNEFNMHGWEWGGGHMWDQAM